MTHGSKFSWWQQELRQLSKILVTEAANPCSEQHRAKHSHHTQKSHASSPAATGGDMERGQATFGNAVGQLLEEIVLQLYWG